jgi:hypothetical protein
MNYKRITRLLRGFRERVEAEADGLTVHQIEAPIAYVLEDLCRAFALSDEETAEVLGEVQPDPPSTLTIPVLGTITGGPEDRAVWERVHVLFDGRGERCEQRQS